MVLPRPPGAAPLLPPDGRRRAVRADARAARAGRRAVRRPQPEHKPGDRKIAITLFTMLMMFGATLTIIGSFFRGTGYNWVLAVGPGGLLRPDVPSSRSRAAPSRRSSSSWSSTCSRSSSACRSRGRGGRSGRPRPPRRPRSSASPRRRPKPVSRREFFRRSLVVSLLVFGAEFGGATLAFLWPSLKGGFGR